MSILESIRIVNKGDIGLVEWDLVGEKVNKLSSPVMARLKEVVQELNQSAFKAVVFISRKPKIFIAGADIDEIKNLIEKTQILEVVKSGQEIINMVEDLKMPTIAAINGACLGGGCEFALACDYRIATDDSSTKIGLPETQLGLIPGFGGCVRLPKLIGVQNALDIILAGKAVNTDKALKLGLVDKKTHLASLEEKSIEYANEIIKNGAKKARKCFQPKGLPNKVLESFAGRPLVFKMAKKSVLGLTKGHYPAPLKALEVIKRASGKSRASALTIEAEGFAEVCATDVSKNLIHVFYMMEGVKKTTGVSDKNVRARKVGSLGIMGAGTMGGGIAFVAAGNAGLEVRMKDINHDAIAKGIQAAKKLWDKQLERRKIDKYTEERNLAHLSGGLDYSGFGRLDVVIEAIVEDMNIKKKVIAETAKHCKPDVIIATNTSSLSVSEMGEADPKPENFVGMHFFNPVDKMPLVEVIRGKNTSDEVVATIFELSKRMGKTPVVVKDGPGFLVNRLLLPWLSEALFFLADQMDIEVVDKIYSKKFGMPMGPFHLIDEIGIDVCLKVLKIFNNALGERAPLPPVYEKLYNTKRLGKKGGKGFYIYEGKNKRIDPAIYEELGVGRPNNKHDEKEIIERGIYRMINEAALVLIDEKIVETPAEVDLGMIMGTGFPPFRGGLLRYADSLGTQHITDELEMLASKFGTRFKPTQPLVNLAKSQRGFYT